MSENQKFYLWLVVIVSMAAVAIVMGLQGLGGEVLRTGQILGFAGGSTFVLVKFIMMVGGTSK